MIRKIESIICDGEGYTLEQIHNCSRKMGVKETRQLIMYFARKETDLSLDSIGGYFNKDHATVLNAIKVISGYIDTDSIFRTKIGTYQSKIDCLKTVLTKINGTESIADAIILIEENITGMELKLIELRKSLEKLKKEVKL
jgi:hypothetical protein